MKNYIVLSKNTFVHLMRKKCLILYYFEAIININFIYQGMFT
ncbi:Uncharacterised protein [Mycobacteroides abscessus subsp. abscessus]|nr:Uncharacterised protein [Mycobacteroides abscessus subsp. abscessus]